MRRIPIPDDLRTALAQYAGQRPITALAAKTAIPAEWLSRVKTGRIRQTTDPDRLRTLRAALGLPDAPAAGPAPETAGATDLLCGPSGGIFHITVNPGSTLTITLAPDGIRIASVTLDARRRPAGA